MRIPVVVAPGHADNAVTISLGYGQGGEGEDGPGRVGGDTGVNVYPWRTSAHSYWIAGASVQLTDEVVPLALTQEHSTTYGRELVREGTLERFQQEPGFAGKEGMDAEIQQDFSFYKQVGKDRDRDLEYKDVGPYSVPFLRDQQHQWGMVIDLNSCIGCNSCLLACQSENNIPIVGKRQVIIGREMHWIRMDRYFAVDLDGGKSKDDKVWDAGPAQAKPSATTPAADHADAGDHEERVREIDDPEMIIQPVACQHCEAAPCETVCPVNATVHNEEGLNLMAYNRCIGTRYCANNCPYKARRFNYFDYNKRAEAPRDSFLGLHPNNLLPRPARREGGRPHSPPPAKPECHRAHARGHRKVHVLHPAAGSRQDRPQADRPHARPPPQGRPTTRSP